MSIVYSYSANPKIVTYDLEQVDQAVKTSYGLMPCTIEETIYLPKGWTGVVEGAISVRSDQGPRHHLVLVGGDIDPTVYLRNQRSIALLAAYPELTVPMLKGIYSTCGDLALDVIAIAMAYRTHSYWYLPESSVKSTNLANFGLPSDPVTNPLTPLKSVGSKIKLTQLRLMEARKLVRFWWATGLVEKPDPVELNGSMGLGYLFD